ncbi:helix-turn-helix domain-containing protein [Eggerthia catenaformis]
MNLGKQIKNYRKQTGMSQEKMAEKIGVSRQAITKWETDAGIPDIENLIAIAKLFEISMDELLSNERKQYEYIYESRTEYDIDSRKDYDVNLGSGYSVTLKAWDGEKIIVSLLSNILDKLQSNYKIKIDDKKNIIDLDIQRLNDATATDAKKDLMIQVLIPHKYMGKIEVALNAKKLNIFNIENEKIEVNGKVNEVTLEGNKSKIEIDSNADMQINLVSHKGAIELNQLSAVSKLIIPNDYHFKTKRKGIATHIYYEYQGKKAEDYSNPEANNYIEFNGMKSELIISKVKV